MDTAYERQTELKLIPPSAHGLDADFSPPSMMLLDLLRQRHSSREFVPRPLPLHTLSRLLWAAFGINRPLDGGRTAPSARNEQEITIYVAQADGLYRFEPNGLSLQPVLDQDLRGATGLQDFVAEAPLNLVYVATLLPEAELGEQEQMFCAALDTGFIGQNVYLFCAAEGLSTVVRGWIDRPALAARMGLGPQQRIIAAQTIGYPRG